MSKTRKNLIFYERQFNTIKGLIPIANNCLSASLSPEKLIKGYFLEHSNFWDITQSPQRKKIHQIGLTPEEENSLSERMVSMMNLLVNVKRISQVANQSQKSNKVTLYELLVRLRDLVLKHGGSEIIPSFAFPEKVNASTSIMKKLKFSLPSKKNGEQKLYNLCSKEVKSTEVPEFVSRVLDKQLRNLYELAHLGETQAEYSSKEIRKFSTLQTRSLAAGKDYEGKAYEIICKMYKVNDVLNQSIRKQSNSYYEQFIIKMEEMVEYYKGKENQHPNH